MNRPRIVRYLRISWTVVCGLACVGLIAMWVRSYSVLDIYQPWGHDIWVAAGTVLIDETWVPSSEPPSISRSTQVDGPDNIFVSVITIQTQQSAGTGIRMPLWLPTIVILLLGAIPWMPSRFSLRTLLIAITLVAVVLGVLVWTVR
jgi:hypothetical protein